MRSTSFCTSAANGAKIVISNSLRFGVLHGLGEIIMNIAILCIIILGTYIGYILINLFGPEKKEFHGTAGSVLVVLSHEDRAIHHVLCIYTICSYLGVQL